MLSAHFHCIAVDAVGHGESPAWQGPGPLTAHIIVDAVYDTIVRLGIRGECLLHDVRPHCRAHSCTQTAAAGHVPVPLRSLHPFGSMTHPSCCAWHQLSESSVHTPAGCFVFGQSLGAATALMVEHMHPGTFTAIYAYEPPVLTTISAHRIMAWWVDGGKLEGERQKVKGVVMLYIWRCNRPVCCLL